MALDELTNQLEVLTALDEADRSAALTNLEPSPQISAALPHAVLTAEELDDEYGRRIALSLAWDRLGKGKPVTLVGWIDPLSTPGQESTNAEAGATP